VNKRKRGECNEKKHLVSVSHSAEDHECLANYQQWYLACSSLKMSWAHSFENQFKSL
jgi:hypothetical protein